MSRLHRVPFQAWGLRQEKVRGVRARKQTGPEDQMLSKSQR